MLAVLPRLKMDGHGECFFYVGKLSLFGHPLVHCSSIAMTPVFICSTPENKTNNTDNTTTISFI